jgi:hypothetical protein
MNINKLFLNLIQEQNILKTTKTQPIVDAIKNRNMITFYYSGPQKPKKDSVLNGTRINAEAVAIGLSKKGNLVVRAWVQPPSVSKKGFAKHGWRTFIVGRMSNVKITDDKFDTKRPSYKEGSDDSMTTTYVSTNWGGVSKTKSVEKPSPTPITKTKDVEKPEPKVKSTTPIEPSIEKPITKSEKPQPEVEPKSTELPQPNPDVKPTKDPIQTTQEPNQEYIDKQKELYKTKQTDWVTKQKEIGGNIKPGQGTRARFSKEVEKELSQPKPEEKPSVNPEDENKDKNLQESLKRIKRLMFS